VNLGAKLFAYIGPAKETRAVRQWADGERKPSGEVMTRLRHAYHVAALLAERDSRAVVQACFQGMNPQLGSAGAAATRRPGRRCSTGSPCRRQSVHGGRLTGES
jgi:hypothetical protein